MPPGDATSPGGPAALYEVITGDLITSRQLPAEARAQLPEIIRAWLDMMAAPAAEIAATRKAAALCYQVFRGDAFQVVFPATGGGLRVALHLMSYLESEGHPSFSVMARLALGVGRAEYLRIGGAVGKPDVGSELGARDSSGPGESPGAPGAAAAGGQASLVPAGFHGDGEVFELSGAMLDELTQKRRRLGVRTPWPEINAEFQVHCLSMEDIVSRWTRQQAQAVALELSGLKQREIAAKAGVTQPAVSQRLRSAGMEALGAHIERYETLVGDRIRLQA